MRLLSTFCFALLLTASAVAQPQPPTAPQVQEPTIIYLVRHAERADDDPQDPNLSDEGHARATVLAHLLGEAGVTHVFTTDYRRTRQTITPLAEKLGLDVQAYDPRDPAGLVAHLLKTPGRHVVVGHSNTTPGLVQALGGDPGAPIEHEEYDRLYILYFAPGQPVLTTVVRY